MILLWQETKSRNEVKIENKDEKEKRCIKKKKSGFINEGFEVKIKLKVINRFDIFNIIDSINFFYICIYFLIF